MNSAALPAGSVVAVVVTRHRNELLAESLAALSKQTHPIAHLVVVDNGPDQPARAVVDGCDLPSTYIPSWTNLGGAGGFALGMLHALAMGADWIWLGDDDGMPADESTLATLVDLAERRHLAAVSPTVADKTHPDRLAFPVRRGLTWHRSRAELAADVKHGADDELVPLIGSRTGIEAIRGDDLTERIFPEARHEVFNETNRGEVLGEVTAFIDRVIGPSA